ncbi:MAG: radical SAM protein [Candidatus Omnitrophica bacterium]|nr:radical SAM protein [Candidatus Omnitrophota bacterium]
MRTLIDNLDDLPIRDKELFYNNSPQFKKGYSIIASRGCPYACSYCCHSILRKLYSNNGKYFRFRSVKSLIKEISQHASKYKIDTVVFYDDCFGYDLNWLKEFTKEYSQKIKIKFTCTTYPNLITEEYVSLLEAASCCSITLGIQSWDNSICSEWFNRSVPSDSMINAIRIIKETKIQLVCDNIFDVPGQDNEIFMNSLLNYTEVKPNRLIFNKLKYYPNCEITEKAKRGSFIPKEQYDHIMEGQDQEGACLNSISSNEKYKKDNTRMRSFLYIMDIFPKSITKYMIKNKVYRYFPSIFNPAIFYFYRILFSFDHDTKLFKKRTINRYFYYVICILWLKLKALYTRKPYEQCG